MSRRREVLTLAMMLCADLKAFTQINADSARHDCRAAYTAVKLPVERTPLLALQHQCEIVLQHDNQQRMDLDLAELRLALLRVHIALHSITGSDRRLPKTIDPTFAGDAAAILATVYKGKNTGRYETAIIRAAWLAAGSHVPMKDAEAAIREAISIFLARGDYGSAGKLIQHLEEPVPLFPAASSPPGNGEFLIELLRGPHASNVRGAIESCVRLWDSPHVAVNGPIEFAIAETYKSSDRTKYLHWLNVAESNDFDRASAELNHLFFDFENYHNVVEALRSLGYDRGFPTTGDDVGPAALRANIAAFGTAALGTGLDGAYYTLQNNNLITKLRLMSRSLLRVSPALMLGIGRITKRDSRGALESTGFLAYDGCTVVTALHALGGSLEDPSSFYIDLPLPQDQTLRSQIHVVAMGMGTAIPTNPANDWLVGKLEPCAPESIKVGGLAEKDRSLTLADNTFAYEIDHKNPVTYIAVGFPGGTSENGLTLSQCILSQRLGYTLAFDNTCYLHGMSGGPVYGGKLDSLESADVVALNTELSSTLDQRITSNNTVTATQRGFGTLSAAFADAAWRASHFESPDVSQLSLVDAQIEKLQGGTRAGMSASERSHFVSRYLESHVPPELAPFWYFFSDLDKISADAFLELTGGMIADTNWLPGVWCSDRGRLTISTDSGGYWNVGYLGIKGQYRPPVVVGNAIVFKSATAATGDTDFILRRRGSDLYLAGFWKDSRAQNWVHVQTSKQCSGSPSPKGN